MRHLSSALLLAFAIAAPTAAHATEIDDFVLTGNGHTYAFSLPATGLAGGEPGVGVTNRVRFRSSTDSSTIDGSPAGGASGLFVLEPGSYGTVAFGIGSVPPGIYDVFYGPVLAGYNPVSVSGYIAGPYQTFFLTGTFQLFTDEYRTRGGPMGQIPYTLTITPEVSPTATPEPASLALLATGSLGLLTALRRRLIA